MEISLKKLNKTELEVFVNSDEFENMPVVPISYKRAVSQINNPACKSEDIVLILAYFANKMVGYLGIVPDNLNGENKSIIKAGWLSCIWVDKDYKNHNISQFLLAEAKDSYNGNIIGSAYVPKIRSMYEKAGFIVDFKPLQGYNFYIRSVLKRILPQRNPKYIKHTTILSIADSVINTFAFPVLRMLKKISRKKAWNTFRTTLIITDIDDNINELRKHNPETAFRCQDDFIWMYNYPWVSEDSKDYDKRYFFTSYLKECRLIPVVNFNKESLNNEFILCLLKNGILKIQYLYLKDDSKLTAVEAIDELCRLNKAHTVNILDIQFALLYKKHSRVFALSKQTQRAFVISKELEASLPLFSFQAGDGDCVFT